MEIIHGIYTHKKKITKSISIELKRKTLNEIKKLELLKNVVNEHIPQSFLEKYPHLNDIGKRSRKSPLVKLKHIFNKIARDNNFGCMSIGITIYNGDHGPSFKNLETANNDIENYPEFRELYLKILNEYNDRRNNIKPNKQ